MAIKPTEKMRSIFETNLQKKKKKKRKVICKEKKKSHS